MIGYLSLRLIHLNVIVELNPKNNHMIDSIKQKFKYHAHASSIVPLIYMQKTSTIERII